MVDQVGQQYGNYRLLRLLGVGSFAAVYLGEHQYLERPAAVKVLHVQMESQGHAAFQREARTIARLDHPHIVRVLDFGIQDQTPYLVMEYTANGTLRTRHPKGTRLSLEQIVTYVKQIASALDYAHTQHVIHRDVKPENILLNAKGEIVLSDFGLAIVQHTLDTLSSGQNMAGTPLYMAPEQIQRHPCPASDQYALAVMVYEWLCGEPPFPGPGVAIFGQHLYQEPPGLCARVPGLPSAVEDVVFRALAKDPARRFTSVQDFATAFEEACFATQPLSLPVSSESTPQELDDPTQPMSAVSATHRPPAVQPTVQPTLVPTKQHQAVAKPSSAPVAIMSVCAPADRVWLEQWEAHLHPLEQAGMLRMWSESHLLAGSPRLQQIDAHLEQAGLIVLLLSADFFSSDECIDLMQRALSRQRDGRAQVVPLLLRPVEWQASPLASLTCIPSSGPAVTEWVNRDTAFDWCVRDIRRLLGQPAITQPRLPQVPAVSSVAQRNRKALLRKVRSYWIEGVLNHSLHGAALIALGLQEQPDAVANPWHLVLQQPDATPHALPTGTRITQVYDDAEGELLILGAPGAGKTTLLLELARDLLDRAEKDEQYPMPVVFNLSSWAMKQQTLVDWQVEELNTKYQVPRKLGQALVDADQILPLLDGLDEVAPKDRTACIETINSYRQEHGLLPLVVCSRQADYLAKTARVLVRSAVLVQPLTQEQVDDYLEQGGESLWALRVALHQDVTLRELISIPLMLSILTLTYHGKPVEELLRDTSIEERQRQIFERYVEHMLVRRGNKERYTQGQTRQRLSWLARQMKQRNQTIFYIEQIQKSWLSSSWMFWVYDWVAIRFPDILMGILVSLTINFLFIYTLFGGIPILMGGLLGGILSGGNSVQRSITSQTKASSISRERLPQLLGIGLLIGLGFWEWTWTGISGALMYGFCSILFQIFLKKDEAKMPSQKPLFPSQMMWLRLVRSPGIWNGLFVGLLTGLADWLVYLQVSWQGLSYALHYELEVGLQGGLLIGLIYGLIAGLLSTLLIRRGSGVLITDRLIWSWKSLRGSLLSRQHISTTLWVIGIICILGCLEYWPNGLRDSLTQALTRGLILGFTYWILLGLFHGISSETIDNQHRMVPNQGIHRSVKNGFLFGLICTAIVCPVSIISVWLDYVLRAANIQLSSNNLMSILMQWLEGIRLGEHFWQSTGYSQSALHDGLITGLIVGLLAGLLNGGLAYLRHYILRFLLWRAHSISWNYPRFLDYCAESILLRKVGGGYIFVHRLLLEYFASLDTISIHDETKVQKVEAL